VSQNHWPHGVTAHGLIKCNLPSEHASLVGDGRVRPRTDFREALVSVNLVLKGIRMDMSRIDTLRHLIAAIGERQIEYHKFFPPFADWLEMELGKYLGDSECVALSNASGSFDFDNGSYRHEGLGFDRGRYRIPLMFRFKNLKDDGDFLVRIFTFYTLEGEDLIAEIAGRPSIRIPKRAPAPLLEQIYVHLLSLFEHRSWFADQGADYAGTGIGFVQNVRSV